MKLIIKTAKTFSIKIHIAGDIDVIKHALREYCMENGFCVTVGPEAFIYTGGEEAGVCIGLVNYPRFPLTPEALFATAKEIAVLLLSKACQWSALIETPSKTVWITHRKERENG